MGKPNDAKDVTPLVNTTNASVPKDYDIQTKSGLVLQKGTEATSQVGQFDSNQQLANSALLHETPDPRRHDLPSTQQHEVPTAHQQNNQRKPKRMMQDDIKETTQEEGNQVNKP